MTESISKKVLMAAGILLSSCVLLSFFLWFKAALVNGNSFETTRQLYLSNYPPFLRNARVLTALYMVVNALAIICLLRVPFSLSKPTALVKFFIILNLVMMIWQMFSLM